MVASRQKQWNNHVSVKLIFIATIPKDDVIDAIYPNPWHDQNCHFYLQSLALIQNMSNMAISPVVFFLVYFAGLDVAYDE